MCIKFDHRTVVYNCLLEAIVHFRYLNSQKMAPYTLAPVTEIGEQAICTNEMDISWEQQHNRKSTHGQSTHLTSLSKTCKSF